MTNPSNEAFIYPLWRSHREMIFYQPLRILILSCAIAFFAWPFLDARFRDAEGFFDGRFCLPIAGGVALIVLRWGIAGRFRKFGFWFALAVFGQAVALQLIDAGPSIHYQHYKIVGLFTGTNAVLLSYLGCQTLCVIIALGVHWVSIRAWILRNFKIWQLLGMVVVFCLSSTAISRNLTFYVAESFFATFVQAVNLGNIVLMLWALPEEALGGLKQRFERLFGQLGVQTLAAETANSSLKLARIDCFSLFAAVWVTALAAVLSYFIYERHPHIQDEVIYLYHARYFADWMLTVPAPSVPEAFSLYMIPHRSENWYSIFPPGWPAILAIGVLFGVPWLVNPILAGLNVLLTYILIQEIYNLRTARISIFLLCVSPWHAFMAMNFMAHTFTLTCALLASLGIAWARKTAKTMWGWVAGFAVGMTSLIRPLDGLVLAGLLGMWAIGIGGKKLNTSSIVGFVLGTTMLAAVVLPYNSIVMGHPAMFPLNSYYEKYFGPNTNAFGFGPERGLGWPIDPFPGHSPLESLINANLNMFSVNIELFGWSTGSMLFVALILFSGAMRTSDYLMLVAVAAIVGAYSLYWFSGGPDFGARYWYLVLLPLTAMTARGVEALESMSVGADSHGHRKVYAMTVLVSLCILSLVNYFPWRALDKYHHYLGMRPDIVQLAREYMFGKSLVLIRGSEHPDYASAWTYNPLDFNLDLPVYAWDRNPEVRARLKKTFPGRPIWIVNGPTMTHRGFEVLEGPLPPDELLSGNVTR